MRIVWRIALEALLIVFLFYSNLLMGEYERSGAGQARGLTWALADIFTIQNGVVAVVASLLGAMFAEFFRKELATARKLPARSAS